MEVSMRVRLSMTMAILFLSLLACSQERRFTSPNSSMEPTILQGEKFAVDTTAFHDRPPSRGDVIVFSHGGVLRLMRVIAISGDIIEGKDFQINLNGKLIKEDYIQHSGEKSISVDDFLRTFPRVTVPTDQVFVMGDNRDFSDDSRDPKFGTVPLNDLLGRAVRIVKSNDPKREGAAIR